MKIKRFVASDMRSAMNLVRKEHGPDAVILSNRRIEEGVEIVAAAHYDEEVVQRALEASRPKPAAPAKPRSAAEAMIAAVTRRRSPEPEPVAPTTSAVAALARAAVGATGRTVEAPAESGFTSRFASLLKPRPAIRPAVSVPVQDFATLPSTDEDPPALPADRFARQAPRPAAAPAAPLNRARFQIDPPLEDMPLPSFARPAPAAAPEPRHAPTGHALHEPTPSPRQEAPRSFQQPASFLDEASYLPLEPVAAPRSLGEHAQPAPLPAFAERTPAAPSPNIAERAAEAPQRPFVEPTPVAAPSPAIEQAPADARTAAPTLSAVPAPREDGQLAAMRKELTVMRQMIEREMSRFTDERLRGCPVRAQAMDLMDEYGFDAGLARDVAMEIPADTELHRARGLMLGLVSRRLPITPVDPIEAGGVFALVGPTGAGKTTTIAKLASRFAEAHAARDVALVTTDTQRIGAREQLYGFGRSLGIAVHEANSGTNLSQLLNRLADYKLVLIDTAGLGQRDRGLAAQLQWLRASGHVSTQLVLPANTSFQDMDEVVRRFGAANPQGLVLTKLDETSRFGSALSIAVDHRLPITWVTDGQDVPDDLHRASAANLVLRLEDLRRAADMPCNPEFNHAVA
ncbi:flagellar biosynthesis protein FlhF [Stenotrophomonas sp. Marseille-Q4652]|uniref:flagellar biosynthesis protein FlhF n=1 Tax=Stenotrophomonas sp. Marseille-Q4652 TaxID=2866595 RepID=UPI001CE4409B|nr:flagellar biosynthesis protein FlhF [Stenotrophomonas sp. Marseille-Q4652]